MSVISYVEVLGYHRLTEQDRRYFEGDALIGATALVHDLQLLTANTDDFQWISDLRISNPIG